MNLTDQRSSENTSMNGDANGKGGPEGGEPSSSPPSSLATNKQNSAKFGNGDNLGGSGEEVRLIFHK